MAIDRVAYHTLAYAFLKNALKQLSIMAAKLSEGRALISRQVQTLVRVDFQSFVVVTIAGQMGCEGGQ